MRDSLTRPARLARIAVPVLTTVLALAGCTSARDVTSSTGSSAAPATTDHSPVQARPAVITADPAAGAKRVDPSRPITISIAHGTLTSVRMTNPAGKVVTGALGAGRTNWHSTEDLGYGRTYTVAAVGADAQGRPVTERSSFTTVDPAAQVSATIDRIGGYALTDGATYGVGIVPVVHLDEAVSGKAARAAVVKALSVTTSPHVAGAWAWYGDHDVHFRPQNYWPSGTRVTVAANIYGKKLGDGTYGASDVRASFTIGRKQVTVAHDNAPQAVDKVRVYRNGTLVRTMNTSMGKHSGTYSGGNYIDFHTMNGTYTVLEHDNPAIMSSQSYGLAPSDGGYPPEPIYYSTKISTDGIYLHYLNTIYAQDNGVDVSHGCLNLNHPNAVWYFEHSMVGDPVQISGTHGPTIDVGQGGDWSVPWSTWLTGGITGQ